MMESFMTENKKHTSCCPSVINDWIFDEHCCKSDKNKQQIISQAFNPEEVLWLSIML
jgi:hypothetical protein